MIKSKLKMSYFLKGLRNSSQQKADFIKLPGRDGRVLFVRQDQLKGTIVDIDYFEKNIYTKIWQSCSK